MSDEMQELARRMMIDEAESGEVDVIPLTDDRRLTVHQVSGGIELTLDSLHDELAAIDWSLRSGSRMTRANLALEKLCQRLGVDRDTLNPQLNEDYS